MMRRICPFLFFVLASACGGEETPATARRIPIEVGMSGYDPAEVTVSAGETVTLAFTRTSDEGCGDTLVIPSENIERDLPLNETVEVTLTPSEPGSLRFTCGMDMFDGTIVVTR